MKEVSTIRIWQILTGLLVICNLGLLATLWIKPLQHPMGPPPPMDGGGPRDFLVNKLSFNDDQKAKYDVLIKEHQQAMRQLRNTGKEYRENYFKNLSKENTNPATVDSFANLIATNQKEIEVVTYKHFQMVRDLCTPAQKSEFDNSINEVLHRMGGQGQGNMPPPRDGNPPPPGNFPPPPGPPPPPPGN